MQLVQTTKLRHDMDKMIKENNKEKITNFVGLLKLQKYIHSDLKKLSEYYVGNESAIHSLYREFRDWRDKYNTYITPINMVADKFIDDYSGLLNLLEELDPYIQKIVLSYIFSACEEYLNAISGLGYPGLGRNAKQDKEVVNLLYTNIHSKWINLSGGFEKVVKEIQKETYAEFNE